MERSLDEGGNIVEGARWHTSMTGLSIYNLMSPLINGQNNRTGILLVSQNSELLKNNFQNDDTMDPDSSFKITFFFTKSVIKKLLQFFKFIESCNFEITLMCTAARVISIQYMGKIKINRSQNKGVK